MSEKKYYVIGTTTPEAWERVHAIMMQDGTLDDNLPCRSVECTDLKEHSPTRATYLLDDQEAEQLRQHPEVKFVHLDHAKYPDLYPYEDAGTANRYDSPARHYRIPYFPFNPSDEPPLTNPTSAEINRAGYQILRGTSYSNPWGSPIADVGPNYNVVSSPVPSLAGTGVDVDIIVGDNGCWFGHPEFANNTGNGPADYIGGNVLPGNGTCDLLDVVLEGPYYIDPEWFNADPGQRLATRWDGTIVPTEAAAKNWWSNASLRSSKFASAGAVTIPGNYTRANCNGSNTARPDNLGGSHGTPCSAQAYGRTQGWAYNANKWVINAFGNTGFGSNIAQYFDVVKIFHVNKPINPLYRTRNPTISSNSWGYRLVQDQGAGARHYYFRQGASGSGGVPYFVNLTDLNSMPAFRRNLGLYGDGFRFKGELLDSEPASAGDELIESGVIFVVAAGNSNQKQVSSDHPDFNNYWSYNNGTPLSSSVHTGPYGLPFYNTFNRRGFPQQLGMYTGDNSERMYPAINIGALDGAYDPSGKERKVNYSDMGNEIDCFAPGHNTVSASVFDLGSGTRVYPRADSTSPLESYDAFFSGTSSACPTAAGMIATVLQSNRGWTWQNVKTWLKSLTDQSPSTFYTGTEPATPNAPEWDDVNSLMGASPRLLYIDSSTPITPAPPIPGRTDIVQKTDFNGLQGQIASVLGQGLNGWGLTVYSSTPVTEMDLITIDDWKKLQSDINLASMHIANKSTSTVVMGTGTIVSSTLIDSLDQSTGWVISNRHSCHPNQFFSEIVGAESSRTTSWGNDTPSPTITHRVEAMWANSQLAREYFNQGGEFVWNPYHTNSSITGQSLNDLDENWASFINHLQGQGGWKYNREDFVKTNAATVDVISSGTLRISVTATRNLQGSGIDFQFVFSDLSTPALLSIEPNPTYYNIVV
jgi:hypothetical protein